MVLSNVVAGVTGHVFAHNEERAAINGLTGRQTSVDLRDWTDFATGGGGAGTAPIGASLNLALAQAAAAGGLAQVLLPRSTTSAPLILDRQILLQSNVTLQGVRGRTALKVADGLTAIVLRADVKTGVALMDLDIDGNATGAPGLPSVVSLTNCTGIHIENVRVHDGPGNNSALSIAGSTEVVLRRVRVLHGSTAINIGTSPGTVLDDVLAKYGRGFANTNAGVVITSSDGTTLSGVRCIANQGHGLYLVNSHDVRVLPGCEFAYNGNLGANLLDGTSNPAPTYADEGWRRGISHSLSQPNLRFLAVGARLHHNQEDGVIAPNGNDHHTYLGCSANDNNLIGAVGGHGIEVNGEHATVESCRIWGNNCGISSNGGHALLKGNTIYSNRGTWGAGIKAYNPGIRVIDGNNCYGNKVGVDVNADTGQVVPGIIVRHNDLHGNDVNLGISDEISTPELGSNLLTEAVTANLDFHAAAYRMDGILFSGTTHRPTTVTGLTGVVTNLTTTP